MNIKKIPPWGTIALNYFGVREIPCLDKNHPVIVEFLRLATKGQTLPDETSWCPAFAVACILGAGIKPVYGLVAKGWKGFGRKLEKPVDWCIIILDSPNPEAEDWQGHVCFWLSPQMAYELMAEKGKKGFVYDPNKYFVGFGGNQNNQVGFNLYPNSLIEACVWPVEYLDFSTIKMEVRGRVNNYVNTKIDSLPMPKGSVTPNQVLLDIDKNKTTLKLQKIGYTILGFVKGIGWLAVGVLQAIPSAASKAAGKGLGIILQEVDPKVNFTKFIEKLIELIQLIINKIKGVKAK